MELTPDWVLAITIRYQLSEEEAPPLVREFNDWLARRPDVEKNYARYITLNGRERKRAASSLAKKISLDTGLQLPAVKTALLACSIRDAMRMDSQTLYGAWKARLRVSAYLYQVRMSLFEDVDAWLKQYSKQHMQGQYTRSWL